MTHEDQLKAMFERDAALREAIRLDEQEAPKMAPDLNARLMQRVAQQQAPKAARTRRLWPWVAAACVAAFLAVLVNPPKHQDKGTQMVAKVEKPAAQSAAKPAQPAAEAISAPVEAPQAAPASAPKSTPAAAPQAAPQAPKAAAAPQLAADSAPAVQAVLAATSAAQPVVAKAETKMIVISERDIPITRPENYKYTPEELAQLKKQAAEAYLKWVELEMEISRNNLQQTAQK